MSENELAHHTRRFWDKIVKQKDGEFLRMCNDEGSAVLYERFEGNEREEYTFIGGSSNSENDL